MNVFMHAPKVLSVFLLSAFLMFVIPTASADTGLTTSSTEQKQKNPGTVSVNQASAKELSKILKGIGESKAEAIVAYREKHGAFKDLNELLKVKGIGKKTLEKNWKKMSL